MRRLVSETRSIISHPLGEHILTSRVWIENIRTPDPIIDPTKVTCSCDDWQNNRSCYAQDNIKRVCWHLARHYTYHNEDIPEELRSYRQYFIDWWDSPGREMPSSKDAYIGTINGHLVVIFDEISRAGFMNLIVDGIAYKVHPVERRYAYKKSPPDADQILQKVKEVFTLIS